MDPLSQIAAALLCYTGVISATEARELAGFPSGIDGKFRRDLHTLARFIKSTGKNVPPMMANWWPGIGLEELL